MSSVPQYLVLMLVAWAIAGALVLERPSDQLWLGLAIMGATTANALVYPYTLQQGGLWRLCSAAMFLISLSISVWIVLRALRLAEAVPRGLGLASPAPS